MAASSSSSSAATKRYDVFISFRGEDTRHSFTAHLYDALCRSSIKAYIDRELNKGDEISPSLFQAIQDSYGSLIVFSENYASSKWCLNELLEILEGKKKGHFVIPVFYNVDPSHVRKQTGSYEKAFAKHEQDPINKTMLEKWKAALYEAANIAGWDSQSRNDQDESKLIQNIVKDVLKKLDHIYKPSKSGLVGIDKRCENVEALLQKFFVVGIWGIGGIGKTTIAKALIDKLFWQYDSCCFFENVREESQRRGFNQLRDELLSRLLRDDIFSIDLHRDVGLRHAMRRLSSKKVLIVLDDVDDSLQLEHLGQELKSLGPRSRIIITTRDKQLLTSLRVKHAIYEVARLNIEESFELFRLHAFSDEYPEKGHEKITKKIVSYTQGTPLALKILGSFLISKTSEEWKSEWKKLKMIPNEEIEKVLKLSFDGLSYENQQIFLDIACFLKGENKERVISLLDSYGFYGATGIRTLQDRALITLSHGDIMQMHDLIQEMGWEVVRKESIQEPGRRSRLWNPEEVCDVLKYNKGTCKVEGIILNISQIKDLHLSDKTFKKMINLRYLNFYCHNFEESGKIHIPVNTQLFSNKLRYLCWDQCPLQSLSSNFCAEKLVELNMPQSHMKRLWKGVQDLVNLKSLNLNGSKQLIELPDFSKASSLKSVRLSRCTNLRHIHPSILSSLTLETLDLSYCKKLESLQSEVHLKSLNALFITNCSSLKEFSLSSEKLEYLLIWGTSVEILHSSIGLCTNLEHLTLSNSLKNIPSDLSKLTSLRSLTISRCTELDTRNLHIILGSLLSLRTIVLVDCLNLSQLPDNIKYLSHLTLLNIQNCKRLPYISELPASIETVLLINCTSLESIMTPKSVKYKPSCYFLANCVKLGEHSLSSIVKTTYFKIKQAVTNAQCEDHLTEENLHTNYIFFPGNRVPGWFRFRAAQNWISIEIPSHSHLLGFAFYCILSPEVPPYRAKSFESCGCYCYLENSQYTVTKGNWLCLSLGDGFDIELISDHVFIWSNQWNCNYLFGQMEKQKANGQRAKKLYFEFYVRVKKEVDGQIQSVRMKNAIKECGVWPIYASEYDISINDLELKKGVKLGYRTDDNDEPMKQLFDKFRPSTSEIRLTSSVFDLQGQHISFQNASQDLPEIKSLCLHNRFNELNYSTSQMELNFESGFIEKRKRLWDIIGNPQELQRKKFKRCHDNGVGCSSEIGVGCSKFSPQPLTQTKTLEEFVFQPPPTDISMQNAWLDPTQMNSAYLLNRNMFCPDFEEMATGGNSLHIDQQSTGLSPWLNQGHPQMNPSDISVNSSLYPLSSSSGLPNIVQMAHANNVLGASSFLLNQGHLQMNPLGMAAHSGLYALSSSPGFPHIVHMAHANNVLGASSFSLNQGHLQMNPLGMAAHSGLYALSSSPGFPHIVQMAQAYIISPDIPR